MSSSTDPIVDLWFALRGATVPSWHGHLLYAAICSMQPVFHEAPWLGVHTLHGEPDGARAIRLPPGSRLGLRLPTSRIALAMALAGQELRVGEHRLAIGLPEIRPLGAAASVSARMVTIKGAMDEPAFRDAVARQLAALEVVGDPEFGPRLVQLIGGRRVIGFALRVHHLSEEHSIRLQEQGLGGRRRMGCGLFRPSNVASPESA